MITQAELADTLDIFLLKFFVILFSFIICWYFINRISYGGRH